MGVVDVGAGVVVVVGVSVGGPVWQCAGVCCGCGCRCGCGYGCGCAGLAMCRCVSWMWVRVWVYECGCGCGCGCTGLSVFVVTQDDVAHMPLEAEAECFAPSYSLVHGGKLCLSNFIYCILALFVVLGHTLEVCTTCEPSILMMHTLPVSCRVCGRTAQGHSLMR